MRADELDILLAKSVGWAQDATALKIVSAYQLLPELRAFWPFSSVDENSNVYDLGGQARTLTSVNGWTRGLTAAGLPRVQALDGTTQYFSRAHEAGLAITGALTIGGWWYTGVAGAGPVLMSKEGGSGNIGYQLYLGATGLMGLVSGDGTAAKTLTTGTEYPVAHMFFGAMRYTPSTELALFINDTKEVDTTSIPASIYASTATFRIGRNQAGNYFAGRLGLVFVCARAVPDDQLYLLWSMGKPLFGY